MKTRTAIVLAAATSIAVVATFLLKQNGQDTDSAPQQSAAPAESVQTTWEGKWEVPVLEGDEQAESFKLAKNKKFHMRVVDDISEFKEGDVVSVLWEPGKVYINDMQVQPYPNERIVLTADDVSKRYGRIPSVREYLSKHRGEATEDEVATRAVEFWYTLNGDVIRQAEARYRQSLSHASPLEAAEAARELVQASGLADSTAVRGGSRSDSDEQMLDVIWKGQRGQPGALVGISLRSEEGQLPPETVTAKRLYKQLVDMLDLLTYGDNALTVRYEGGSLFLEGVVTPRIEGGKP